MRKLNHYIILFLFSIALVGVSCKTNNGDIGNLYGIWVLESVYVGDTPLEDWRDNISSVDWRFQNNIVQITRANALHDYEYRIGTFTHENHTLELNFTHSDDENPSGQGIYAAPEWLYFEPGTTMFNIDSESSSSMTLSTMHSDGKLFTYHLRKQ